MGAKKRKDKAKRHQRKRQVKMTIRDLEKLIAAIPEDKKHLPVETIERDSRDPWARCCCQPALRCSMDETMLDLNDERLFIGRWRDDAVLPWGG